MPPNERPKSKDALNIGLIGAGAQGQVLMDSVIKISKDSPVHFKAVCDIWGYHRNLVERRFKAYRSLGHQSEAGHAYVDVDEMLDKETDLDAVIVAHARLLASHPRHGCHEEGPACLL